MKKLFCMIALAAVSFGSVYAAGVPVKGNTTMQKDTTKKWKKSGKDTTWKTKKDTTKM